MKADAAEDTSSCLL